MTLTISQVEDSLSALSQQHLSVLEMASVIYVPAPAEDLERQAAKYAKAVSRPPLKRTGSYIEELVEQGLLLKVSTGLICNTDQVEDLTASMAISGRLRPAVEAMNRPTHRYYDYKDGFAEWRRAFYLGRPEHVPLMQTLMVRSTSGYRHPMARIGCGFRRLESLQAFSSDLRFQILAQSLVVSEERANRPNVCLEYIESQMCAARPLEPVLRLLAGGQYVLNGQFSQAQALCEQIPDLPSLLGILDFLKGSFTQARVLFDQAKHRLNPAGGWGCPHNLELAACFHLLTLIREENWEQARTLFGADSRLREGMPWFRWLIAVRTGHPPQPFPLAGVSSNHPLHVLWCGLICQWEGQGQSLEILRGSIGPAAVAARQAGFSWLESQLNLLLRVAQGEQVGDWLLLSCIGPSQRWRQALQDLISVTRPPDPALNPVSERLVWFLNPSKHSCRPEPKLQKASKTKGWTPGRSVAHESTPPGCASDADKRAFKALWQTDGQLALVELIGHPLVFSEDSSRREPIEVLSGSPELRVERTPTEVHIQLFPRLPPQRVVGVVEEGPNRIRIVTLNDKQRKIYTLLGPEGMRAPLASLETVQEMLAALSSVVPIASDVTADASIEEREADAQLHLRIRPWEQGIQIELLVRPLGEGGPEFAPGKGGKALIASLNRSTLQTVRSHQQERDSAQAWVAQHPTLAELDDGSAAWYLGELDVALGALEELKETGQGGLEAEWPEGEPFRLKARASLRDFSISGESKGDWLELSGELQLDENLVLSLAQLLDLSTAGSRFLRLQDGQFVALTEEFRRRLEELKSLTETGRGGKMRLHPLAASCLADLDIKAEETFWRRLRELNGEPESVPQPSTFQAELRDYQSEGFRWLCQRAKWGVGACLADDMGLGKTIQALGLLVARAPDGPSLVVAPTSVCGNWMAEAARFAPTLKLHMLGEQGDRQLILGQAGPFDLIIASYGLLDREIESLSARSWNTIVLDEAQAIKNHATRRFQAATKLEGAMRVAMTGTPIENRLDELWSLFRFLNPGLLGSLDKFRSRFAIPIERGDARKREHLRRLIAPFLLRRTKGQVLRELPPRTEITLDIDLSVQERALYEAIRRRALEKLAGQELKPIAVLAELMRLRRACCHPSLVLPSSSLEGSKLEALQALLEEIRQGGHRALVFSQFVDHLSIIRQTLDAQGVSYQYLDGSTPSAERTRRVAAFQAGAGEVFLISLRAGGVGLNLTGADYVIHMDPWWNPAVEDQASDRAHRIGQQRPVTIYRLVTKNTVEEKIVALHKHKRELAEGLLEGAESGVRLCAEDLMRLMRED